MVKVLQGDLAVMTLPHSGFCIPAEQKTWHPEGPFTSTNTDKLNLTMALVVQPSRPSGVGGVAKYLMKPEK